MTTQKAYRLHAFGAPDAIHLDDVPVPAPGPSQVLVAVKAVGMNPFDWKIRDGAAADFEGMPLPVTLGADFVGTVVALGEGASRFVPGDRVMTVSTSLGAYAEHIAVDEAILAPVPASLDDVTAATLPMPALTAWQSLHAAGDLRPGMRILIHGASGTAGAFAVQFAKAEGAYVIGTASAKNRDYVRGLGADEFVDYAAEKFEDRARNIDLVLDYALVGGAMNTTDRSWQVLAPGGNLVSVADPSVAGRAPAGHRGVFRSTEPDADRLRAIGEQVASGKISAKVARVFGFGELLEAMALNERGGTTGRLIVDVTRA